MTKLQLKARFDLAVKNDDKASLMLMLNPLIEKLSTMIIAGTLIKTVKAHLSNNGITGKACDMLTEMAVIRAEKFVHYKAK